VVVIDEYLAVRAVGGACPKVSPTTRTWPFTPANIGRHLASATEDLGIAVHGLTRAAVDTPGSLPPNRTTSLTSLIPMHQGCGGR
jgi:hypothetical protein